MNKILKDFLETDIFDQYKKNNEVIFVMLVGSRAFGLIDERSDFDFLIFVKENNAEFHNYYLEHFLIHEEGHRVHWYCFSEDVINSSYYGYFWAMSMYSHPEENVFIIDEKEYQKYYKEKEKILLETYKREVLNPDHYLRHFRNIEIIPEEIYSKHLYRYLTGWYWIKYKTLTEEQKSWLKILKRIRWIENFNNLYKKELQETLLEIQESIKYFDQGE